MLIFAITGNLIQTTDILNFFECFGPFDIASSEGIRRVNSPRITRTCKQKASSSCLKTASSTSSSPVCSTHCCIPLSALPLVLSPELSCPILTKSKVFLNVRIYKIEDIRRSDKIYNLDSFKFPIFGII